MVDPPDVVISGISRDDRDCTYFHFCTSTMNWANTLIEALFHDSLLILTGF